MDRNEVELAYRGIQERFCAAIEAVDGSGRFITDSWDRPGGGGGLTRILADGIHIEKAAVNFSAVEGRTPEQLSESLAADSNRFYASGVSIIVHPRNPYAPTFHANIRYFETDGGDAWFGGGADLTPYYLFEEDARHFHSMLKDACDRHASADYTAWKARCDDYFRLPHRGEARGIGGIFFDHLSEDLEAVWAFQRELGNGLDEAYVPILKRRVGMSYGRRETKWQEIRRGRYAEFNLVWDRGTRFGLETAGRTESILASLPPVARWVYAHEPEPDSPEAQLLEMVRSEPRAWV
ncbi:MAG: oxygen-dependent coproporphyrinogen oxidase [Actinobacteria bacterium]|nr:MAG: oxygen-dependent coproporphyrinogen oxidase [Actinomycetota bacterium]